MAPTPLAFSPQERVQSFREETEAAKPFSIANPFYCVELAVGAFRHWRALPPEKQAGVMCRV